MCAPFLGNDCFTFQEPTWCCVPSMWLLESPWGLDWVWEAHPPTPYATKVCSRIRLTLLGLNFRTYRITSARTIMYSLAVTTRLGRNSEGLSEISVLLGSQASASWLTRGDGSDGLSLLPTGVWVGRDKTAFCVALVSSLVPAHTATVACLIGRLYSGTKVRGLESDGSSHLRQAGKKMLRQVSVFST